MELVVYTQYYRFKSTNRQLEIDECLRRNRNHPGISKVMLFKKAAAPPPHEASVPLEVVESDECITYAEWVRWMKPQGAGIGLLLNAAIYLDEGLEHLRASLDVQQTFLALTRYNPGHAGFHLNDYPHWSQEVSGARADAELPESLLYARSFPLEFPGCDKLIATMVRSHGFRVRSVHHQASTGDTYAIYSEQLYGGVSDVHPSLAPDEDTELEFTLLAESQQNPTSPIPKQIAVCHGAHQQEFNKESYASARPKR